MSATDEVPAGELEARRARLLALKAKAGARGAASPSTPGGGAPQRRGGEKSSTGEAGGDAPFSGDRSKYFASFLLNTLKTKPEGEDNTQKIPGTVFTEYGVSKLLEGLKDRSETMGVQGKGIIKRFHDFLTAPAAAGQQTAGDVNLEHLERFVNFLTRMQTAGWEGVKKDFASGDGKELLSAFSKPRVEILEAELDALKLEVSRLAAKVEALSAKK